jgi:subtilisin family serine protease
MSAASTQQTPSPSATPTGSPSTTPSTVRPAEVTQRRPGWALDRIDQRRPPLDQRFTTAGQGQGVTVYVVDGLFDVSNAEFGGRASVGLASGVACGLEDGINHGLFVAGLVAGRRTGVAKQAKIVSVGSSYGCEGGNGGATEAQMAARIVRALNWVAQHARRPAVVNLSLNVDVPAPTITTAVKRLVEAGLTVVASAGNDGEDACKHPPAGLPAVITAAGSTKADKDAGLNHGRCVDLFAPAEGITSVVDRSLSPNRLVTEDVAATSWAAPLVSGAAALYLSVHPAATPAEVRAWLLDNATKGALRGNLHGSPNRLLFTGGPL